MEILQAILALLGTIAGIVAVIVNRQARNAETLTDMQLQADIELRRALRDKRIEDAAFWARRRKALGKWPYAILMAVSVALLQAGCITRAKPAPMPLIIGQRVYTPAPGDVLTIPAHTPPAKQWYLVDDVGLMLWLGVDPSKP
jgi:hypothetical protein